MDIFHHITSIDMLTISKTWNISIHHWLKYYVMVRLMDKSRRGSQIIPTLATFLVSSVWHGPASGLLFLFYAAFALTTIHANILGAKWPRIVTAVPPIVYKIMAFVILHFIVSINSMVYV